MGGYGFHFRTTTFDSWSFLCRSFIWIFFLLGFKMSLPCEGHQWLNQGDQRLCPLCIDPPYSVKLVLPSLMKCLRNKSHFNILHEIRVVDDWGCSMTTNKWLTGGNKMGPLLSAMQGASVGTDIVGYFHDQICSADPGSGLTLSLRLCPPHWKKTALSKGSP